MCLCATCISVFSVPGMFDVTWHGDACWEAGPALKMVCLKTHQRGMWMRGGEARRGGRVWARMHVRRKRTGPGVGAVKAVLRMRKINSSRLPPNCAARPTGYCCGRRAF